MDSIKYLNVLINNIYEIKLLILTVKIPLKVWYVILIKIVLRWFNNGTIK